MDENPNSMQPKITVQQNTGRPKARSCRPRGAHVHRRQEPSISKGHSCARNNGSYTIKYGKPATGEEAKKQIARAEFLAQAPIQDVLRFGPQVISQTSDNQANSSSELAKNVSMPVRRAAWLEPYLETPLHHLRTESPDHWYWCTSINESDPDSGMKGHPGFGWQCVRPASGAAKGMNANRRSSSRTMKLYRHAEEYRKRKQILPQTPEHPHKNSCREILRKASSLRSISASSSIPSLHVLPMYLPTVSPHGMRNS